MAWRLRFDDPDSPNIYDSIVDAVDMTVLWQKNLTSYDHFPAHGLVYTSDDPLPNTPKGTSTVVPRQDVPFNGGDFFPHDDVHFDWWNGGARTTTTSNNVDAYADRDGDNAPDPGSRPTAVATEDFSFSIDLTMDPSTYQPAAVTNLFYWNNRIHDWLYQMGFDESAGNFQTDNFGLGGSGSDPVMAEAQDNRDGADPSLCNANFGTPADGNPPRMQMFQCDSAVPERDGDLDNVVIGHEYGHGVHSRLVPTAGNQAGNEGWSDYFGLSLVAESDDPYDGAYGIANYLFAGNGDGIRSDPYSTDLGIYKRTYADINDASTRCQVKTCSDDPTETCTKDEDCSGNPPATCDTTTGCKFHQDCEPPNTPISQGPCRTQVHRTGELWANALWNMRMRLTYKWGFATGDATANKLVIDGMKLSPNDPTFLDGRDSILMADVANNAGVNQCLIWDAFAKMGMGASAVTTDVFDINPIEAFDLPAGCAPVAQVS
ncbi:MAG: M36 family metallopeptidase, partial [Acidimicrobiia bacterium]|nr:M36 family metallopeptidase [Acidimicrobiia bacterium]